MGMEGTAGGIRWSAQGEARDDAPSVLFIHGAGANRAVWWQQFAAFAPEHHVVAYDLPGFGDSDAADPDRIAEQAIAAAVDVLAAAGARRARVVCQSLGGWTGVRLALARPDLVDRLVLCCTLAGIAHPPGIESFLEARPRMGARGPAALGLTEDFAAANPLMASVYRQLGAFNPQADPALAAQLFSAEVLVPPEALGRIAAPVLMIAGEHDPIWPPAALAGILPHFADGRMVIVPGTGHSPYFEQPEAYNRLVADFLDLAL